MVGALWIWLAWAFFWDRYATINWAAAYVAPLIVIEGLLLIWLGAIGAQPIFTSSRKRADLAALALFAFALFFYPFLAPFMGRSWFSGEFFGIAPDPTALATLALLACAAGAKALAGDDHPHALVRYFRRDALDYGRWRLFRTHHGGAGRDRRCVGTRPAGNRGAHLMKFDIIK